MAHTSAMYTSAFGQQKRPGRKKMSWRRTRFKPLEQLELPFPT